mmetsp:Transcript_5921/g.6418  ORF Transcript_5921/g.6418 Transcript_5921/m.6418 type:complete len:315 (+) Transcript_5921:130-1074(+)
MDVFTALGSKESSYSYYEIFVHPFLRDSDVILSAVAFYFFVQYATMFLMPIFSRKYRTLSLDDKRSFAIRVVSIVNGLFMFKSAFFFVDGLFKNGGLHDRHYETIDGYRTYRLVIVGYFLWDIIVCVAYNWGFMWTVHAVASFTGTYFLAFPFSDQYATYYSGMFETSNAFIHGAALLKMLDSNLRLASILEYIFAALFFCIRVIGGTIVTSRYYMDMVPVLMAGKGHSHATIASCLFLVAVVMILQYVWFWEIIRIATGMSPSPNGPTTAAATSTTSDASSGAQAVTGGAAAASPEKDSKPRSSSRKAARKED